MLHVLWNGNVTVHQILLLHRHVLAELPHRDIRPRGLRGRRERTHCAGAKTPCRVISLAAFKHSLRIMSIDSLPEACLSLMTFDIIFWSISTRRSTLSILFKSFQSSRSDRHTVPGKSRAKYASVVCSSVAASKLRPASPACPTMYEGSQTCV